MQRLVPWSETQAIFVDFAASASPGLQDKRKRLPRCWGDQAGWNHES
jgi:hypothetical protein